MDKSKKHMTPAEMKKKEEISSAMKRKDSKEYMQKKVRYIVGAPLAFRSFNFLIFFIFHIHISINKG